MSFDDVFERLLGNEGGFQNDREDRGNWTTGVVGQGQLKGTRYGISAMSYPDEDIRGLSKDRAKFLYRRDFWDRIGADKLHTAIGYQLMDAAINHGTGNAIRMLQRGVDAADDGLFGPATRQAVKDTGVDDTLKLFNAERIVFFTKISTFGRYGKGWMRRVAQNLRYAADDYNAPWYGQVNYAA